MNPIPKEKAKEIFNKMQTDELGKDQESAKRCALIAVDEIDNVYQKLTPKDNPYFYLFELEYWQEVKQEIIKL